MENENVNSEINNTNEQSHIIDNKNIVEEPKAGEKQNPTKKHITGKKKVKRMKWFSIGFLLGILCCFFVYNYIKNDVLSNQNKTVDITKITSNISAMKELVTAELEFQSVLEIKDENAEKWHSFFTSKEILLLYKGKVSAGVDLSTAEVSVDGYKVIVKLPSATIKHKEIDYNSIKVYNTKTALPVISISDNELLLDALKRAADQDMDENANTSNIIEFAENEAKEVISKFIYSLSPDFTVEIQFVDNEEIIEEDGSI